MKRSVGIALLLVATISAVVLVASPALPAQRGHRDDDFLEQLLKVENTAAMIRIGFDIAPVPLNLRGKNEQLVGLGSYAVNTGGCTDCHTNPPYEDGGDPFQGQPERANKQGYLAGGTSFGPFVSRNLTPDRQGLPAGLTLSQFLLVMRHGIDLKNEPPTPFPSPLLQVMPWPVIGKKTDLELRAIYEYLSAIPSR